MGDYIEFTAGELSSSGVVRLSGDDAKNLYLAMKAFYDHGETDLVYHSFARPDKK